MYKNISELSELQRLLYRELYRKSFYEFVKAFWHTCEPAKMIDGKVIKIYCEIGQYMCKDWVGYEEKEITLPQHVEGEEIIDIRGSKHNLSIAVPPRHSKSIIFNVMLPTWLWISYPIKAASISHNGALAGQMNSKRYAIINSPEFRFFWPEISLVTNTSTFLKDSRGGELYSLNRNAFTGFGADLILNDDLTNAETARKDQAEMSNAWSYYQNTMPSRINDINKCIILNIQQRLAPNDITGHIMNDAKLAQTYSFVTLPAIFEKTTHVVCPISGEIITFEKNECLWPERFGDYLSLRYQVGESIFQTQYLQHPIASDKTVIKQNYIVERDLPETPGLENADIVYASHDFPVKDKDTSDYLGSCLAYRVNSTLYIVDSLEKRLAFTKSVEYVKHLDSLYSGIIQVIEDKANGSPILQQLQDEVAGMQAYQPGTASKTQRLESASLYMSSGNVVFVKTVFNKFTQQWEFSEAMQNLIQRLLNFPFVEHDDIVDSVSMLILFVFMDRRYIVYGRAFDERNIVDTSTQHVDYSMIFFNKEGDTWKALEAGIQYSESSKLIIRDETRFKGSIEEGMKKLKEFGKEKSIYIDCSATSALQGFMNKSISIERYVPEEFDKSVSQLNLAFANKSVLIDRKCVLTKSDIENFKFNKSKDDTVRYTTEKDGFVSCIRSAMMYFGGIN